MLYHFCTITFLRKLRKIYGLIKLNDYNILRQFKLYIKCIKWPQKILLAQLLWLKASSLVLPAPICLPLSHYNITYQFTEPLDPSTQPAQFLTFERGWNLSEMLTILIALNWLPFVSNIPFHFNFFSETSWSWNCLEIIKCIRLI
jgi:hypothetical protein